LGQNFTTHAVRLFVVSTRTGVATPMNMTGTFVDGVGTPVSITTTAGNFNFNIDPVTDRIRVTTDTGQNFRIDPNTGAFVDGDLGGAPGSVPGLNMDAPISGATAGVDAVAYTNRVQNAASSTLYTLNGSTNTLYTQAPGNSGT